MKRRRATLLLLLATAAAPDQGPHDPPGVVTMSPEQQQTVKLATVRAERRHITEPLRVPGIVAFDQDHLAVLRPLAQARITRILVQAGDPVRQGQALAELDMPRLADAEDNLAATRAQLRKAQAGIGVARAALRRGEILSKDGALSRAEAERRRLDLFRADADADAAQAQLGSLMAEIARLNPSSAHGVSVMSAPLTGVIASIGAPVGAVVDAGAPVLSVVDLSVVQVQAQVPEDSAAMIAVADPAQIRLSSAGGRIWTGQVASIGAALDPQARTLPVRVRIANAGTALRAGMFVDVTLTTDKGRDGIVIPATAVQLINDAHVAFTPLPGNRFQRHDVKLGVQRPDWTEVQSGLDAGDSVVTEGSFALKAMLQQQLLGGNG